jgi:DNA mismatch repair ATPase MutS
MWRIATHTSLNPVTFSRGVLKLEGAHDISLTGVEPVKSSIHLQENPHAILTGPNGGGKSSFLRSVLQSVLIGHAFGFAPAQTALMPRFDWIASGLQLRDTPGKLSMFETEVKFAADCLRASRQGPGLILFDELFHSTNPPDSARSATQFLRRLWKRNDVFTIVSTHIFPLVATAPKNVQAICCPATKDHTGKISYSYGVQPGVCDVSSVHTVWEKFGLTPSNKSE